MKALPKFVRAFGRKFFFHFTIEVPKLTKAECYGITQNQFTQLATGQIENIDRTFERGTSRFPNSERFDTAEAASLECDRWRYHLQQNFSVRIDKWSCGNLENLLCDTKANLDGPVSLELEDFINQNHDALESHRASQDNGEKQLRWLSQNGEPAQRQRALTLIAKQAELIAFCQRNDVESIRKKAASLKHYADLSKSPLESLFKATSGIEGQALRGLISRALSDVLTIQDECAKILAVYEQLTTELQKLKT